MPRVHLQNSVVHFLRLIKMEQNVDSPRLYVTAKYDIDNITETTKFT